MKTISYLILAPFILALALFWAAFSALAKASRLIWPQAERFGLLKAYHDDPGVVRHSDARRATRR